MTNAFVNAIAEQWPALAFVVVGLMLIYCGGFWRFCVRTFATATAILHGAQHVRKPHGSRHLGVAREAARSAARARAAGGEKQARCARRDGRAMKNEYLIHVLSEFPRIDDVVVVVGERVLDIERVERGAYGPAIRIVIREIGVRSSEIFKPPKK